MDQALLMLLFLLFPPQAPFGKPAPASEVFRHVPEGAVLVMAADVASLGQGFNKGVDKLLNTPFIVKSAPLQPMVQGMRAGRQMMMAEIGKLGFDPFKDIRYAMMAVRSGPQAADQGIVVLGGKIPPKALEAFAGMSGAQRKGELWQLEEGVVLAQAKDGAVILGSPGLVEQALAGKHKNQAIKPLLRGFDRQTYMLVAFQPDQKIHDQWKQEDPFARPLLSSIKGLVVRMTYKNTVVKVHASEPKFVKAWGGMLEGLGKLALAAWYSTDGILDIGEAYLSSLHPVGELAADMAPDERAVIETLVTHRREIAKLAGDFFLGKKTKVAMRTNMKERSATLTVSSLSMAPLLLAGMGWFMLMPTEVSSVKQVEAQPARPKKSPKQN